MYVELKQNSYNIKLEISSQVYILMMIQIKQHHNINKKPYVYTWRRDTRNDLARSLLQSPPHRLLFYIIEFSKQIRRFTTVCTSLKKITKTHSNHNEFQEFNRKYSHKNLYEKEKNYRTDVHNARTKPFVPISKYQPVHL